MIKSVSHRFGYALPVTLTTNGSVRSFFRKWQPCLYFKSCNEHLGTLLLFQKVVMITCCYDDVLLRPPCNHVFASGHLYDSYVLLLFCSCNPAYKSPSFGSSLSMGYKNLVFLTSNADLLYTGECLCKDKRDQLIWLWWLWSVVFLLECLGLTIVPHTDSNPLLPFLPRQACGSALINQKMTPNI